MNAQSRKILIMGLPGSGKTTVACHVAQMLGAVHFNGDEMRLKVNRDLGFSLNDRIEQARRMGFLCDLVVDSGGYAIADFICPTPECREAFSDNRPFTLIFCDRITKSRYADTNKLFVPPKNPDLVVTADGTPLEWARRIVSEVVNPESHLPHALFLGRFQPFHDGHKKLIEQGIKRVGRAVIGIRDTHHADPANNPLTQDQVESRIVLGLAEHAGKFTVIRLPNVTDVFYGRSVGFNIERLYLDADTEAISATAIRKQT